VGGPVSQLDQIQEGGRPPSWKISNGHISATVNPVYFIFVSGIGFLGLADSVAPLPVGSDLIWRPSAILSNNSKWHNSGSAQDRDIMSTSVVGLSGTANLMVKFSLNMIQTAIIKQQIFILKTAILNTLVTMTVVSEHDIVMI